MPTTATEVGADEQVRDIDDRRAVAFERRDVQHRWVGIRIDLPQRRLRIEPLRVLLVAVEDERLADEPVGDERRACSAAPARSGR